MSGKLETWSSLFQQICHVYVKVIQIDFEHICKKRENDKLCSEFKQHWHFDRRAIITFSQICGVVFRVLTWRYFSNLIFPISQILSVSHGAMTWRGLITGYLQCGATLIRAWNNDAIFHILSVSVWRGCGIRVMWIIWERNGRRRVHDLSQTRKLGCFLCSPVCNLLVMLNTPR